jgi:myo-inositol 2-dehydrogenase / D-chiro-inositol 1-dehydrogenase
MPPITLNRRRFLGCSAAAGLALSQSRLGEGAAEGASPPVRIGLIGLGNRGTSLLRTLLELPSAQVVAMADDEARHLVRAQGIVDRARGFRPEGHERIESLVTRSDLDAVVVALPCDLHATVYRSALDAGKHLYAEKPMALTAAECESLLAGAAAAPDRVVHVGFQRRSNPRYRDAVALIRQGELGTLIAGNAAWVSSNGPMNGHDGWLGRRARSGDWMVEQAAHVWDVFHWIVGGPPVRACGQGRRDLFAAEQPTRDVTDHYAVQLEWAGGFHLSFLQSWVAPADERFTGNTLQVMGTAGGLDFGSGALTYRDRGRGRQTLHPGNQADTRHALQAFLDATGAALHDRAPVPPPLTLAEARDATLTGLLVRKAVDERRVVTMDEIRSDAAREAQTRLSV